MHKHTELKKYCDMFTPATLYKKMKKTLLFLKYLNYDDSISPKERFSVWSIITFRCICLKTI